MNGARRTLAAWCALMALAAAVLLPGLHGLSIGGSGGEVVCEHHHDEDQPGHDRQSCEVCKLIELLPVAIGGKVVAGQAWWTLEPVRAEARPESVVVADEFGLSLNARGPPRA